MKRLRSWILRLIRTVVPDDAADMREEIASHLQMHIEDNLRAGMSPDEARRHAAVRLGGASQTVERMTDARRLPLLDGFRQDVVYAARMAARTPGFTAAAILTMALGIGANSAIFSLVNAVLLRPLPFRDPERLVMAFATVTGARPRAFDVVTYPDYADWANQNQSFEAMAAFVNRSMTMAVTGQAVLARGVRVTPNIFRLLGTTAALGRTFHPDEQQAGTNRVVVLSDAFWRRWFNASDTVLGQTIWLDDEPYEIVGVMPSTFQIDQVDREQLYLPLPIDPSRGHAFLRVVGRLKAGTTIGAARADLAIVAGRLTRTYPRTNTDSGVNLAPLATALARDVRTGLLTMLGAVTLVLFIACANVAGLTLARGATRQRELAVRAALGAGRRRLVRQLLTESALLAAAGGAAGLLVADWSATILAGALARQFHTPRIEATRTDFTVVIFALAVALVTGFVVGALPAFVSSRPDLQHGLRDGGRSTSEARAPRLRSTLVIVQTALALVLLAGAATLLKTFWTLRHTHPGFDASEVLAVDLWLPSREHGTVAARANFYGAALERVRAVPGVRSAAFVADLPLHGSSDSLGFQIVRTGTASDAALSHAGFNIATSDYFKVMKIPIVAGREFSDRDGAAATPVAVINETAARTFWPGESALGHQISLPGPEKSSTLVTIVGVTGDVRHMGLDEPPRPEIYLNSMQSTLLWPALVLVARTDGDAGALSEAVTAAVKSVNPRVPVERTLPVEAIVAQSIGAPRVYALLLSAFAAIALTLAAVGLFGLVSYGVSQRTHEIGVRIALGAGRGQVVRLVLGQGLALAATGAAVGICGALAASRLLVKIVNLSNGVEPRDPVTLSVVTGTLLLTAAIAAYLPARRAARVDPMVALRSE